MKTLYLEAVRAEVVALLEEVVSQPVKFRFNIFFKKLDGFYEELIKLRNELIKELGVDGKIQPTLEDGSINPNIEIFKQKFGAILEEEIDLGTLPKLTLKDIEKIDSKVNFYNLQNLGILVEEIETDK